jgi:hypothetical protein
VSERQAATIAASGPAGVAGLFSVDADAHLRKLAASMFPTPAQLPVELVRAALGRGAATVRVEIRRRRLAVVDDGRAIAAEDWQALSCALDNSRPSLERERAIAALHESARPGIGLLAALLPGAQDILIASPGPDSRPDLRLAGGSLRLVSSAGPPVGTRVIVRRRHGDAAAESRLLAELCAGVDAAISLNGRALDKKPILRRALVRQTLEPGAATGAPRKALAVPARGEICRIWLLDRQIPWQLFTSASCAGLVFDAALESRAPATAAEFTVLADAAVGLYDWLCAHYRSFPAPWQDRIEELIFRRIRATGDPRLGATFAPFRLSGSAQRLSLDEVRRRALAGPLAALPADGAPGRFPGPLQEALLLTPRQIDFLVNDAGVVLSVAPPAAGGRGLRGRLAAALRRSGLRLLARLPRRRRREARGLLPDEERLCRGMEAQLLERAAVPLPPGVRVAMTPGRGLFPASWRPAAAHGVLWLRRDHPLVRAAARSVARDSANAELAWAALAPRPLLTADGC